MRALVTGISGFLGGTLSRHLTSQGWEVSGFDQRVSTEVNQFFLGSLLEREKVRAALEASQPEVIFHLAGTIKAQTAQEYFAANVFGTLGLFEALVESGGRPRVVIVSTSAVYGAGLGRRPISEQFALRPVSDYAISKATQELVAQRFWINHQIPVIIARTFNLIGPGQPAELACSAFARQVALSETQASPDPIYTGRLDTKRDFVDARDAARAYELLAKQAPAGRVYNVCSGQAVALADCLKQILHLARQPLTTQLDPTRLQKNEVPSQVGNPQFIQRSVHWQTEIPLEQSLEDLLNDWRARVKK